MSDTANDRYEPVPSMPVSSERKRGLRVRVSVTMALWEWWLCAVIGALGIVSLAGLILEVVRLWA